MSNQQDDLLARELGKVASSFTQTVVSRCSLMTGASLGDTSSMSLVPQTWELTV